MLLLGHMAFGSKLVEVFRTELPKKWIFLGAILPDLIDKPLYYIFVHATGRSGAAIGLISGTRTFGHSGLLLLTFLGFGLVRGSLVSLAVAAGMLTHLGLDLAGDSLELFDQSATVRSALFPFLGFEFWAAPARTMSEHLFQRAHTPYVWISEVFGFMLLLWDLVRYRKTRSSPQGLALRRPEP